MKRNEINDLLSMCLEAPERQLCSSVFPKVKNCIEISDCHLSSEIKLLLDECARYSLASGFTMVLLDTLWKESKKLHNGE